MVSLVTVIVLPYSSIGAALFAMGATLYSVLPVRVMPNGVLRSEVVKKLFSDDLQGALYPSNVFFAGAQSDSAGVDQDTIEIPQDEDGDVETVVNPTKLPLQASTEEDKKKSYSADLLVTKPTVVTLNNELLTTYDKRAAKLRKHRNSLETQMAERILYGWSPSEASQIKQTTGTTNRTASAPGATGNRKRAIENDFIDMMMLFDKQDIPRDMKRKMLVPAELLPDLLAIRKAYASGTDKSNELLASGAIFELFTFQVYVRSRSQIYTEAAQPVAKAFGAATVTTDNQSILFWHDDFVRYIKGTVNVAMDTYNKPELAHGRAMNALVRGGSTISRLSQKGVAVLVEDNA